MTADLDARPPLPSELLEDRLLAVARRVSTDALEDVVVALVRAGVRVIEVTMDSDDAAGCIERLGGEGRLVGAGTVRSIDEAADALAAGARFLVSPHTDPDLVRWASRREVPVLPGAFTPTEVAMGWAAGASAVKLFPAGVGGTALLQALSGPFAGVPIVPSGGVDAGSVGDWLDAGAVAVAVGSWLTGVDAETAGARAQQLVAAVAASRS